MNQIEIEKSGELCIWEMNYQPDVEECKHPLPGDWHFGGATGEDPRSDPRWLPQTFIYRDRLLRTRHMTTEPFCIHVALTSYKERVEHMGVGGFKVYYISVINPGEENEEMIYADMDGATRALTGS